jgi:hypothetical protein
VNKAALVPVAAGASVVQASALCARSNDAHSVPFPAPVRDSLSALLAVALLDAPPAHPVPQLQDALPLADFP